MGMLKHLILLQDVNYDDEGYCLGCQRTAEEVETWRDRTEEEQLWGIEVLRERKLWRLVDSGNKNITT